MHDLWIFGGIILLVILNVGLLCFMLIINRRVREATKTLTHQYNLIVKIQSILKNKSATNAVAENAEMIYQDLLQNLIPIIAAMNIMQRINSEHPL